MSGEGDLVRVAAESVDVVFEPEKSGDDIQQPVVALGWYGALALTT